MKQIVYPYVPGTVEVREIPEPQIKNPTDIKIKIAYSSLCGTDMHMVKGIMGRAGDKDHPATIGHEPSGTVVEVGEGCTKGFKVGDKVMYYFNRYCGKCYYCRNGMEALCEHPKGFGGAMSEYCVVDEGSVFKLPDDADLRISCLAEPVSVAIHAVENTSVQPGNSMAIIGGGAIGLLSLQVAKLSGACPIVLFEPVAEKRQLALELGADYVIDSTREGYLDEALPITEGRGFDCVVEAAGGPIPAKIAFDLVARGGRISMVAMCANDKEVNLNIMKIVRGEITIKGSFLSPYTVQRAIALLPRLDLEKVITAEFDVDDAQAAIDAHLSGKHPKVIVKFAGRE